MSTTFSDHKQLVLMSTDLVDSAALKVEMGDLDFVNKIAQPHNSLFREILASTQGAKEITCRGDGYLVTFPRVSDAVIAALRFQHALRNYAWESHPARTRIGIHVGEGVVIQGPESGKIEIVCHAADMCARVMNLAQGGQILLTRHAYDDGCQFVRQH